MVVPANTGDVGGMIAQAMAIYRSQSKLDARRAPSHGAEESGGAAALAEGERLLEESEGAEGAAGAQGAARPEGAEAGR